MHVREFPSFFSKSAIEADKGIVKSGDKSRKRSRRWNKKESIM